MSHDLAGALQQSLWPASAKARIAELEAELGRWKRDLYAEAEECDELEDRLAAVIALCNRHRTIHGNSCGMVERYVRAAATGESK